jgi:hypothetical protein
MRHLGRVCAQGHLNHTPAMTLVLQVHRDFRIILYITLKVIFTVTEPKTEQKYEYV